MFTGLSELIAGRPARVPYESAFVAEVRVEAERPPEPRLLRFVFVCWVLIAVKHVAVIWAVQHYHMPFHQLVVNLPTWIFGVMATASLYVKRG